MSDASQGPGWWQATDGRWYPPPTSPPQAGPPPSPPSGGPPQVPLWTPAPPPGQAPSPYQVYRPPMPGQTPSGLPSVQGLAVASLVLGICGLASCAFCFIGLICSLVGLPLGIVALVRINRGQADPGPKGLAIAGIVCSAVGLALAVAFLVLFAVGTTIDSTS